MPPENPRQPIQLKGIILILTLLFLSACVNSQPARIGNSGTPAAISETSADARNLPSQVATQSLSGMPTSGAVTNQVTPTTGTVIPSEVVPANQPANQATQSPTEWTSLPVIPSVSQEARSIYAHGLTMGNDPHAFSKIGDCQSIPTYFLSYFDQPGFYNLGDYTDLQETIDWYASSFSRQSLAVKGGFNAAAILSPFRADPKICEASENPIACEVRLHHPSIAIISLEEWWAGHPENYATYMRQIIEYLIAQGVVPIVATKADNLEGNNLINQTIASLAQEYDIPLWNFWSAVQSLPNHGLIATSSSGEVDMFHLTHSEGYYFYNDPARTQSGWSVRNLTALQVLDAVRRGLSQAP